MILSVVKAALASNIHSSQPPMWDEWMRVLVENFIDAILVCCDGRLGPAVSPLHTQPLGFVAGLRRNT